MKRKLVHLLLSADIVLTTVAQDGGSRQTMEAGNTAAGVKRFEARYEK